MLFMKYEYEFLLFLLYFKHQVSILSNLVWLFHHFFFFLSLSRSSDPNLQSDVMQIELWLSEIKHANTPPFSLILTCARPIPQGPSPGRSLRAGGHFPAGGGGKPVSSPAGQLRLQGFATGRPGCLPCWIAAHLKPRWGGQPRGVRPTPAPPYNLHYLYKTIFKIGDWFGLLKLHLRPVSDWSEKLYLLVTQSAKCTIMVKLQLLQSIIFLGTARHCCHSPHRLLLHTVITPGALNCSSFYIGVQGWRIFEDEFISVAMLNGQCFHWRVHSCSMTLRFFTTRWVAACNVDFWWNTDQRHGFSLKSQQAVTVPCVAREPARTGFMLFS